jgi:nicotinic acid mononucleotide adenylyltransferase
MITIQQLLEAKKSTIVLAFGRFSPPTNGHELLVKATVAAAKKYNADHIIYASRTQDAKKNPLNVNDKVAYLRHSFKGVNFVAANEQVRTFIEAVKSLSGKYDNLVMMAGSDRIIEYKKLLDKYNGKDFTFKTILVVSAGERDPDDDSASGMSATKMRGYAAANDFNKFKAGCPSGMSVQMAKKMFDDVRTGMKITEEAEDSVREQYIKDQIFNVGDVVLFEDQEKVIEFRGANYVILEGGARAWLQDLTQTEKVNEAMKFKQEDKLKIARIIAMSLGYIDAETKSNPTEIINAALRGIRGKALNPEAKKILARMLSTATSAGIDYDSKLSESITPEEKAAHNLSHNPGTAQETNHERIRKIHHKVHEDTDTSGDEKELSEDDLDEIVNALSEEDFLDAYDEDDFETIDEDSNVCEDNALNEVLTKIERIRARMRMKKTEAKRERAEKIALKKHSTGNVLAKRARRMAEKALKMKLAKKPLTSLSVAEKERLEARIAKMRPVVTRLAMKMTNKVRKIENERLAR